MLPKLIGSILLAWVMATVPVGASPVLSGDAQSYSITGNLFQNGWSAENSMMMVNGQTWMVHACGSNNACKTLLDGGLNSPISQSPIVPGKCRFPFAWLDGDGLVYLICGITDSGGDTYLWYSADGMASWQQANGGAPILTMANHTNLTNIFNVSIARAGEVWHMLIEGSGGLWYSHSAVPSTTGGATTFDANVSASPVIAMGGNAELKLHPDGKHLYAVHGQWQETRFGGYWYITFSVADINTPMVWQTFRDSFSVGEVNVHLADPSVLDGPNGSMIMVGYNQGMLRLMTRSRPFYETVSAAISNLSVSPPAPPTFLTQPPPTTPTPAGCDNTNVALSGVTWSADHTPAFPPSNAGDGNVSTFFHADYSTAFPHYLRADYAAATSVCKYSITPRSGQCTAGPCNYQAPYTFTLSGCTGSTCTVLDTQTGVTGYVDGTPKVFNLPSSVSYPSYRLDVQRNVQNDVYLTISEFGLYQ